MWILFRCLSPPHLILSSRSHLSSLGSFRSNRFHLYTTDARAKTTFAVGWRTLQVSSSQVKHAWQEDPNSDEGLDREIDEMAKAVAAKSRPSRTPALQGIPQRFVTVILKVDFLTGLDPQSGFSNKVHLFSNSLPKSVFLLPFTIIIFDLVIVIVLELFVGF